MSKPLNNTNRTTRPKGCFIVLIGPDGCGKSTVTSGLIDKTNKTFNGVWHFHWRPKLLPKLKKNKKQTNEAAISEAPPSTSKYRGPISTIRYLYYWADFVLGYWFIIFPKKITSTLIIGERYFPDVLVHPERYGFSVPKVLMRITAALVPQPDAIFLLTGKPEDIYARKQELSIEEIREQLASYTEELTHWRSHALIDTSNGADCVIDSILTHINTISTRDNSLSNNFIQKYAFPSIGQSRLLLDPSMPIKLISKLYSPGSTPGKTLLLFAKLTGYTFGRLTFRKIKSYDFGLLPLHKSETIIRNQYKDSQISISYYLGNKGPRSKVTAQVSCAKKIIAYIKIGNGDEVTELLANEYKTLNQLKPFLGDSIPLVSKLINDDNHVYLTQSAPLQETRIREPLLNLNDSELISTVFNSTMKKLSVNNYCKELNLTERISSIEKIQNTNEIVNILNSTIKNISTSQLREIVVGTCHGDYTIWNTLYLENNSLYIFDWEYSRDNGPAFSDLFHFLRMHMQLVLKSSPENIYKTILDSNSGHYRILKDHAIKLNINPEELPEYFSLYLIQEILRHAETGSCNEIAIKILPSQIEKISYLCDCLSYYVNKSI